MSEIVDKWVDKLGDMSNIGEMTHRERLEKAFDLEEPDMVPACPQYDYWQIMYAGYNYIETWDDIDKCTDAALKTFADFRPDIIQPYMCPSFVLDPYLTPEQRENTYDLRDGKSYVLFHETFHNIDDAIKQMESKPWEKYGLGRTGSQYLPHFDQLLDFRNRTGNTVPVVLGCGNVSNNAEFLVGTQNIMMWSINEKEKLHYLFELFTEQLLGVYDALKPYAEAGVDFLCVFGGARTWGPRQIEEFGRYDKMIAEAATKIFRYPWFHLCGNNLPLLMAKMGTEGYSAVQYDEPMQQLTRKGWTWAKWCEWTARLYNGKICSMNSPTCQTALHHTPEDIEAQVKEFIQHTTPWTTAVMMPGCEPSAGTPVENVHAMIDAARKWGKYPECKTAAAPLWTDEEFETSLKELGISSKISDWAYSWRRFNNKLPQSKGEA